MDRQKLLLQDVLEVFRRTAGLPIEPIDMNDTPPHPPDDWRVTAVLQIAGNDTRHWAWALATQQLRRAAQVPDQLAVWRKRLAQHNPALRAMVITDYVNPQLAGALKDADIEYIDVAGNAFIHAPPVHVFTQGFKPIRPLPRPTKPFHRPPVPVQILPDKQLRVLFALLCHPQLAAMPYRDIAKATGFALGTVGHLLQNLTTQGYVLRENKRPRLVRLQALWQEWARGFAMKLRPKLVIDRYRAPTDDWWRDAIFKPGEAWWGGDVAADKLTHRLKPETVTLYADAVPTRLILKHRLQQDRDGPVEILRRFWTDTTAAEAHQTFQHAMDVVPPPLVYADLMATGDDRTIEIAKLIETNCLAATENPT